MPATRSANSSDALTVCSGPSASHSVAGIILNLMPCVFPVLFLKGLALVQSSREERSRMRAHDWPIHWAFLFRSGSSSPSLWYCVPRQPGRLGISTAIACLHRNSCLQASSSFPSRSQVSSILDFPSPAPVARWPERRTHRQLLHGRTCDHSSDSLHRAAHGCSHRLRAGPVCSGYVFHLHSACGWPCQSLTCFSHCSRHGHGGCRVRRLDGNDEAGDCRTPVRNSIWLVWVYGRLFTTDAGDGSDHMARLLCCFLVIAIAGWTLHKWPAKWVPPLQPSPSPVSLWPFPLTSVKAQQLKWQPYSQAALDQAHAAGPSGADRFHRSLVPFMPGSMKSSCSNPAMWNSALSSRNFVTLRADWTQYDPAITQQLTSVGRSGVPAYVLYPAGHSMQADVLPELLTKSLVLAAIRRDTAQLPVLAPVGHL